MGRARPPVLAYALGTLLLGIGSEASEGKDRDEETPFSRVEIRIEYNATDEDVGVQLLLDGEPWSRVKLFDPRGRKILDLVSQRSLRRQGLTELFFESSEPSLEEVSLEEVLARFPEGKYEFFLLPGTLLKLEVLAIEENGNQTISSGEFLTSN